MCQSYPAADLELCLRQIRLVTILPGQYVDTIACELRTVYLDDMPVYDSLSYVWGDRAVPREIRLNGAPYGVTRNLEAALRRLRHPTESRVFWIDMICIDQNSSAERTHQVNLMHLIYSRAREVFVWLGDCADSTEDDVPFHPEKEFKGKLRHFEVACVFHVFECLLADEHLPKPLSPALQVGFLALAKISQLTWWHRVWTLQEVLLPPTVRFLIGDQSISWDMLVKVQKNLFKQIKRDCGAPVSLSYACPILRLLMCRTDYQQGMPLDFLDTIDQCRMRQCTDPRDKVFGLLGLFTRSKKYGALRADYIRSTEEVFTETSISLILCEGNLNSLIRPQEKRRNPRLPTWVSDLSVEVDIHENDMHLASRFSSVLYKASRQLRPAIRRYSAIPALGFKGLLCDEVSLLPEDPPFTEDPTLYAHNLENLCNTHNPPCQLHTDRNDLRYAIWRLIMRDTFRRETESVVSVSERVSYEIYTKFQALYPPHGFPSGKINTAALYRFFITKSGYMGMGPRDMRVGDAAYVLLGGNMPFILRKTERHVDGNELQPTYEYIGHCYVQGIMYGEALEGVDISKLGYVYLV